MIMSVEPFGGKEGGGGEVIILEFFLFFTLVITSFMKITSFLTKNKKKIYISKIIVKIKKKIFFTPELNKFYLNEY